jgi:hypothetical protein
MKRYFQLIFCRRHLFTHQLNRHLQHWYTEHETQDCENTESQLACTTMHSTMEVVDNMNRPFVTSVFSWAPV